MRNTVKIAAVLLVITACIVASIVFFQNYNVAVLNPQGEIADKQRNLMIFTVLLALVVVVPVFTMLALFSWKYREGNKKANYRPDWAGNKWLEMLWWGIPCVIIAVLSVITWQTSHELDPYKPIQSSEQPVEVQVVALQWKWLFIYPEYGVASVNKLAFPEKTPVNFTLTSDAPMNSFWIPSLGSQVYAMSGMSTKLHLIANGKGEYDGYSANISGDGFADMKFSAESISPGGFGLWVEHIKQTSGDLTLASYNELAKPTSIPSPVYYKLGDSGLYDKIVMKYMTPGASNPHPTENTPQEHQQHDIPDNSEMIHTNHMDMEGM